MGHDAVSKTPVELTPEWLSKVIHVHIHDVDENGLDHYPLVLGNIPYQDWLTQLKQAGMQGIVVLELKGERMKNWTLERVMAALTDSFSAISQEVA